MLGLSLSLSRRSSLSALRTQDLGVPAKQMKRTIHHHRQSAVSSSCPTGLHPACYHCYDSSSSSFPLVGPVVHPTKTTTKRGFASQRETRSRNNHKRDNNDKKDIEKRKPHNNTHTSGIAVVRKAGTRGGGYCYGCGADLVSATSANAASSSGTDNPSSSSTTTTGLMQTVSKKTGYWASRKDELKKSQIKNWALCPRCQQLQSLEKAAAKKQAKGGGSRTSISNNNAMMDALHALGPDARMTEIFRQEVSKIRTKEKVVVVLCVDAINISGTLIKTIRNYVGGNPILLAVTRCDLLPPYVWERHKAGNGANGDSDDNSDSLVSLKEIFRQRAADIVPAEVYLCSEDAKYRKVTGGLSQLTLDLWQYLNGRDPYIIGAANIGKSTLTDILIAKLASKGERAGQFDDRLGQKRLETLRRSRITKSSLPGTTLQNVRVPCFGDHTQALWDTPGLLLDESLKHFPIRNLRAIRAQRPVQIVPQTWQVTDKKAFALLICEKGNDDDDNLLPLLRVEVRLKKNATGDGPVRLVWNSTLDLKSEIVDLTEALREEDQRMQRLHAEKERQKAAELEQQGPSFKMSKDQRQRRKEQRRREFQERVEKERQDLGAREWLRREEQKRQQTEHEKRFRDLAQLSEVHQVVLERNVGTDIAVANFGWLGVLAPRTTLIKTYAPSTGVRVSCHATLALPIEWGEYTSQASKDEEDDDDAGNSVDSDSDSDDEYDFDDWDEDFGLWDDGIEDMYDDYGGSLDHDDPLSGPDRFGFRREREREAVEGEDVWARFSGPNVGWQFDPDGRFLRGEKQEGWNPIPSKDDSENNL